MIQAFSECFEESHESEQSFPLFWTIFGICGLVFYSTVLVVCVIAIRDYLSDVNQDNAKLKAMIEDKSSGKTMEWSTISDTNTTTTSGSQSSGADSSGIVSKTADDKNKVSSEEKAIVTEDK